MAEQEVSLSVCVVARNAAHFLPDCLSSLSFADEVVVALDRCTDNSKEVALKYTNCVFEIAEPAENPRRALAESFCQGNWILLVDADETVPEQHHAEILGLVQKNAPCCYALKIRNFINGRYVQHGWGCYIGAQRRVTLYPKGSVKRNNLGRIHPSAEFTLPIEFLSWSIDHDYAPEPRDFLRRLEWYTTERAKEIIEQDLPETYRRNVRRVFSRFFKCYVMRKGYKEGYYGFFIALMAGLYPILSFIKARVYAQKLFDAD